jgi:hypothetical protein
MWPYWLLFLTPAVLAVLRLKPKKQTPFTTSRDHWTTLWRGMFIALVLMIGLRHEVGGDWLTYIEHIDNQAAGSFQKKTQDPAFAFFNELAIQTGLGVYLVNLLSAVFFSWGLLVFCRAQPRPWLALAVAVPYLITVVAMGYTRQSVAIGVAMLGMVALGRGSTIKFVLWIALAATFHKSAVILIPLAILANTKRRILTLVWVLASGIALFLLLLQESVDFLRYGYIESKYQSSGAGIRIAMNAVPAAIFLFFRKRFQLSQEERSFWTWMAWIALLFVVLLKVSPSSTAVDRVALYWIPLQLLVLAHLPNALGRADGKNLVWVCAIVCYSAAVHFVWLMYAETAFAWLPYQFYPWFWLWE